MRLLPAEEALELASAVDKLLGDVCDAQALRAAWDSPDGRVPGLWKRLAELGLAGLTVPETQGGGGVDLTFALPVLAVAGRHVLPEPLVETLTGAQVLAAIGGAVAGEWLSRVAEGAVTMALRLEPDGLVAGAEDATLLLLGDNEALWVVPRDAARVRPVGSADRGMRLAEVGFSRDDAIARVEPAVAASAYDWGVVAVAATLVGVGEAMLEMAVRYAKQREQFGRAIGSFQAIKHQLADVYVALSFAQPVVRRGAWSVAHDLPTRARDASHAKHTASVAARRAARCALQVHAGIGYTYEHDLHMWLKRTWSLTSLWGSEAHHRERVARAVLAGAATRVP